MADLLRALAEHKQAGYDAGVQAERDRVTKLLYFWSQTERECGLLDAIRCDCDP